MVLHLLQLLMLPPLDRCCFELGSTQSQEAATRALEARRLLAVLPTTMKTMSCRQWVRTDRSLV